MLISTLCSAWHVASASIGGIPFFIGMLEKVGRPGGGWLVHTSLHKKQLYQFVRFHHFCEELFKFGALEMERELSESFLN